MILKVCQYIHEANGTNLYRSRGCKFTILRIAGMNSGSAALLHTMQRHREILQDYGNEFRKTRSNITQQRQREDLLGGVRRDME